VWRQGRLSRRWKAVVLHPWPWGHCGPTRGMALNRSTKRRRNHGATGPPPFPPTPLHGVLAERRRPCWRNDYGPHRTRRVNRGEFIAGPGVRQSGNPQLTSGVVSHQGRARTGSLTPGAGASARRTVTGSVTRQSDTGSSPTTGSADADAEAEADGTRPVIAGLRSCEKAVRYRPRLLRFWNVCRNAGTARASATCNG
jgi:hypothetical protein